MVGPDVAEELGHLPMGEVEERSPIPTAAPAGAAAGATVLLAVIITDTTHPMEATMEELEVAVTEDTVAVITGAAIWIAAATDIRLQVHAALFQAKITVTTQEAEVTAWINRRHRNPERPHDPERLLQELHLSSDIDTYQHRQLRVVAEQRGREMILIQLKNSTLKKQNLSILLIS